MDTLNARSTRWSRSVVARFANPLRALLLAFGTLGASFAAPAAELVPLMSFFRHPAVSEAVMSPDGSHVAALMAGGPDNRQRLVMINLKQITASKVLAAFSDADITGVHWVNDTHLVYSTVDDQAPSGDQPGYQGLFSIDRDGLTAQRRLIKSRYGADEPRPVNRELAPNHGLFQLLRDGTNDVIVQSRSFDGRGNPKGVALLRLDTATGLSRPITQGAPADVLDWVLDSKGMPRVAIATKGGTSTMYAKAAPIDAAWTPLRKFQTFTGGYPELYRLDASDRLLMQATADGSDNESLLRVDLESGKVEPLVSLDGFDFSGSLVFDAAGNLLGVRYLSDARSTHWYSPALKALQAKIDALLPATVNLIDCGDCGNLSRLLVTSLSDRQPAIYHLYDVAGETLELLAKSRPWIDPKAMASRDFQRFKARDGLELPMHVTRPPGVQGPSPAVVLVHGGPWVRGGEWRWDADSQFLASRGYVVIEPEFRGSTGYGRKLFRAGFKQWGLAMQDDVADAARWAVAQGYADPKRIAIAGASYGGYATLMGLIRDPELFRCGVEWAGVSDINLMYSIDWTEFSDMWKRYGMPVLVGDREKDAAQLAATSPVRQAAKLKQPLLMAYGTGDYRVPLEHGSAMRDALRSSGNANVEFVTYTGEGHGWLLESTRADFWGRVERFLQRNLAQVR